MLLLLLPFPEKINIYFILSRATNPFFSPLTDVARNICDIIFANETGTSNTTSSKEAPVLMAGAMVQNVQNIENKTLLQDEYRRSDGPRNLKDLADASSPQPIWSFNVNKSSSTKNNGTATNKGTND